MSLDGLPAAELARIDAICLDYELKLRSGHAPEIETLVAKHGGTSADILRRELELVHAELDGDTVTDHHVPMNPVATAAPSGAATLLRAGTKIGPYVIEELLGRGGMGVVFKANDPRLDRKVAIKMLTTELAQRHDLNERFQREARAVAAISHPNIVELFDVGSADGCSYAVMEYLDGELLDTTLARGKLPIDEIRRIGAQIADALATAHDAGVVHRDLKPHNIMLVRLSSVTSQRPSMARSEWNDDRASASVKLFDFGLSRMPATSLDTDADKTLEGMILGTPGYMAPEQVRGESVSHAADIFSLGCILYEAFYGTLAFDGPNKAARFAATLDHHPPADPIRRRDDVELADLIDRCLRKNPAERPSSAATIASQLRSHNDSHPLRTHLETGYVAGQLARRRFLAVAGGGLVGGIVGGTLSRRADELNQIRSIAVLSFTDEASPSAAMTSTPQPIGNTSLRRGERLSAMLVHELTRITEITVPRFRSLNAETPREFRELGSSLEVDAFLTGNVRTVAEGRNEFWELDLQIISASNGMQLWGKRIQTAGGDSLLAQSRLASEIAAVIGKRLTSTADQNDPPSVESFSCLVDGQARSDPDSLTGLEMALQCFQEAHDVDRRFADPIAGIALTSITLAAQSPIEKSLELVRQARQRSDEAIQLDPQSISARLAKAMLDWQTVGRYEQAERAFQELIRVAPNHWQVRHQYGLLQLATGRHSEAAATLRESSLLNPMSLMVKVDRARAAWFSGNAERAIQDAILLRDRYDHSVMARGLLVDIYEFQFRFADAASQHDTFESRGHLTAKDYFAVRKTHLISLPYGPFGDACNVAIWTSRAETGIDDLTLGKLVDPMPPMFPLLLTAHPSFAAARLLPRAQEILPPNVKSEGAG